MYKVKNITKGKLLLFDIGIKLDSGEIVDLDAKMPREKSDASVNLRVAEDNELIAILHKEVNKQNTLSFDPIIFIEMERRIREQIQSQMQVQTVPSQPQHHQSSEEVQQLTAKLSELINKMGTQPIANSPTTVNPSDEYVPNDESLRDVHAKALRRMTKGTEGHVEAKETNGVSDASKNADELDDLFA